MYFKMTMLRRSFGAVLMCVLFAGLSTPLQAAELVSDTHVITKAVVAEIITHEQRALPGTDVPVIYQRLIVEFLEGSEKGKRIGIENDYVEFKVGDELYVSHTTNKLDGKDLYAVSERYRLPVLVALALLFIVLVAAFGGLPGLRGLASLIGGMALIFFILFPSILHGYSPIGMSLLVASLIVVLGSYVTHGFNWTTTSAVLGMIATITVTGVLAYVVVGWAGLTGFESEEAVYLNLSSRGSINIVGLLLGGMLIGLLGVLYDAAIGQAVAVEELRRAGPHLSRVYVFKRALRIGREHIGALVNTLAIAYVGASLPLFLLFVTAQENASFLLNKEVFATEIIRTLVGSCGLVLAVPITTYLAVLILFSKRVHIKPAEHDEVHGVHGHSHHGHAH
jgi:uncharacterized membrane protein